MQVIIRTCHYKVPTTLELRDPIGAGDHVGYPYIELTGTWLLWNHRIVLHSISRYGNDTRPVARGRSTVAAQKPTDTPTGCYICPSHDTNPRSQPYDVIRSPFRSPGRIFGPVGVGQKYTISDTCSLGLAPLNQLVSQPCWLDVASVLFCYG